MRTRTFLVGCILLFATVTLVPLAVHATSASTNIPNDVEFAGPLDASINSALKSDGLTTQMTTAVVPIVGYGGSDATLRLAQINGPSSAVTRVKAVLEIDNDASHDQWQFTSLIPVSTIADGGRGHRIDGVGITAIITK